MELIISFLKYMFNLSPGTYIMLVLMSIGLANIRILKEPKVHKPVFEPKVRIRRFDGRFAKDIGITYSDNLKIGLNNK